MLLASLKFTECHRQRPNKTPRLCRRASRSLLLRAVHTEAIWLLLTTATLEESRGHTFFQEGNKFNKEIPDHSRSKRNKTVHSLCKVLLTFSATVGSNSQEHKTKGRHEFRVKAVRATLTPSNQSTLKLNSTFEQQGIPSL